MEGISLKDIFKSFTGGELEMNSNDYAKLYKETGIIDKKFSVNDANNNFSKVKSGKVNFINFFQFVQTIDLAAVKKKTTKDSLIQQIVNRGGSMKFDNKIGADDSMIDFAKMTILLAFHEYPINDDNNDRKRADLLKQKFNEKYGKYWSVLFLVRGNISTNYITYFIDVHYNGYYISIWKHK